MTATPSAPLEVVERTRRAQPLDGESVAAMVRSWADGTLDDEVMAAWCMAVVLRGVGPEAVAGLTRALVGSGERLELAPLGPTGDVQTTGAVGDTAPVVAAPLAAALGVKVASICDRGRGAHLGTADKLEAIPGFEADLGLERFIHQVRDAGVAMASAVERLAPAQDRLGALREDTATDVGVDLVTACLAARAVCGGGTTLALHAPAGEGGVLGAGEGPAAVEAIRALASHWGRRVLATLTPADQPVGRGVGTAVEIAEAARALRGEGGAELAGAAVALAGDLAEAAGVVDEGGGPEAARAALSDGRALRAAERWVEAQGGDPAVWTDPGALPSAPERFHVNAQSAGRVARVGGRGVGEVARWLGAGRLHADQAVDPVVGVELLVRTGDEVGEGDPLAVVHARDAHTAERAAGMLAPLIEVTADP